MAASLVLRSRGQEAKRLSDQDGVQSIRCGRWCDGASPRLGATPEDVIYTDELTRDEPDDSDLHE
jgi:hypothetical protein